MLGSGLVKVVIGRSILWNVRSETDEGIDREDDSL